MSQFYSDACSPPRSEVPASCFCQPVIPSLEELPEVPACTGRPTPPDQIPDLDAPCANPSVPCIQTPVCRCEAARRGLLTTSKGAPISNTKDLQTLGPNGPGMIGDVEFFDKVAHFNRERIPERVIHAKGTGVFGYFELENSMKCLTSADFLQRPGSRVKVFLRLSTMIGSKGSADTVRDPRGFALKFYTKEGNYDIAGLNMPVFYVRDAMRVPDLIHAQKPSPDTNLQDFERVWDFFSLTPETLHMITWVYSDRGLVKDFRKLDGFGVNTFVWVNKNGERVYVKYHFRGREGCETVYPDEAQALAGIDPDFSVRLLHDTIAAGRPMCFDFCVQLMRIEDACKVGFDPLDCTKSWPEDQFPLYRVGKLVFDRNPDNYFAQVEQAAFDPGSLVPGIELSADKMLQGRSFAYADAQRYRLGANFTEIPVNRPIVPVTNTLRDGAMTHLVPTGRVNYKPNSLEDNIPREACAGAFRGRCYPGGYAEKVTIPNTDDFSQPRARYLSLCGEERDRMADAIGWELVQANKEIQVRQLALFEQVHPDFACRVRDKIRFLETGRRHC